MHYPYVSLSIAQSGITIISNGAVQRINFLSAYLSYNSSNQASKKVEHFSIVIFQCQLTHSKVRRDNFIIIFLKQNYFIYIILLYLYNSDLCNPSVHPKASSLFKGQYLNLTASQSFFVTISFFAICQRKRSSRNTIALKVLPGSVVILQYFSLYQMVVLSDRKVCGDEKMWHSCHVGA